MSFQLVKISSFLFSRTTTFPSWTSLLFAICFFYLDDLAVLSTIMFNGFDDDWLSIKSAARKQVIARPVDGISSSGQVVPLPRLGLGLTSRNDSIDKVMLTRAKKEKGVEPDPLAESFVCPISLEMMTGTMHMRLSSPPITKAFPTPYLLFPTPILLSITQVSPSLFSQSLRWLISRHERSGHMFRRTQLRP